MDIKMCYSLQLTEWLTILNRSQMLSGDMFSLWIGGNQWSVSTLEGDVPHGQKDRYMCQHMYSGGQ